MGDRRRDREWRSADLTNSTISNNRVRAEYSYAEGTGIANGAMLALTNSTITMNVGQGEEDSSFGGGIANSGTVTLANTIIVGITNDRNRGPDWYGALTSQGYNLIQNLTDCTIEGTEAGNRLGSDPLLGPIQDNGGPTPAHALLARSPPFDAGTNDACPETDQRGVTRPQDGDGVARCDIGAFEVESVAPPSPQKLIAALRADVQHLLTTKVLNKGQGTKLDGALAKLERGDTKVAANQLHAFVNQVTAFHKTKKRTSSQAQPLMDAANRIIDERRS